MDEIIEFFNKISEVDTEGVEPMVQPVYDEKNNNDYRSLWMYSFTSPSSSPISGKELDSEPDQPGEP